MFAHATNTRACDIFYHRFQFDAFRPFSTVHTNVLTMRFRFEPLSRSFSDYQFPATEQCKSKIKVGVSTVRIDSGVDAFSMKTLSVLALKCTRFQTH